MNSSFKFYICFSPSCTYFVLNVSHTFYLLLTKMNEMHSKHIFRANIFLKWSLGSFWYECVERSSHPYSLDQLRKERVNDVHPPIRECVLLNWHLLKQHGSNSLERKWISALSLSHISLFIFIPEHCLLFTPFYYSREHKVMQVGVVMKMNQYRVELQRGDRKIEFMLSYKSAARSINRPINR